MQSRNRVLFYEWLSRLEEGPYLLFHFREFGYAVYDYRTLPVWWGPFDPGAKRKARSDSDGSVTPGLGGVAERREGSFGQREGEGSPRESGTSW